MNTPIWDEQRPARPGIIAKIWAFRYRLELAHLYTSEWFRDLLHLTITLSFLGAYPRLDPPRSTTRKAYYRGKQTPTAVRNVTLDHEVRGVRKARVRVLHEQKASKAFAANIQLGRPAFYRDMGLTHKFDRHLPPTTRSVRARVLHRARLLEAQLNGIDIRGQTFGQQGQIVMPSTASARARTLGPYMKPKPLPDRDIETGEIIPVVIAPPDTSTEVADDAQDIAPMSDFPEDKGFPGGNPFYVPPVQVYSVHTPQPYLDIAGQSWITEEADDRFHDAFPNLRPAAMPTAEQIFEQLMSGGGHRATQSPEEVASNFPEAPSSTNEEGLSHNFLEEVGYQTYTTPLDGYTVDHEPPHPCNEFYEDEEEIPLRNTSTHAMDPPQSWTESDPAYVTRPPSSNRRPIDREAGPRASTTRPGQVAPAMSNIHIPELPGARSTHSHSMPPPTWTRQPAEHDHQAQQVSDESQMPHGRGAFTSQPTSSLLNTNRPLSLLERLSPPGVTAATGETGASSEDDGPFRAPNHFATGNESTTATAWQQSASASAPPTFQPATPMYSQFHEQPQPQQAPTYPGMESFQTYPAQHQSAFFADIDDEMLSEVDPWAAQTPQQQPPTSNPFLAQAVTPEAPQAWNTFQEQQSQQAPTQNPFMGQSFTPEAPQAWNTFQEQQSQQVPMQNRFMGQSFNAQFPQEWNTYHQREQPPQQPAAWNPSMGHAFNVSPHVPRDWNTYQSTHANYASTNSVPTPYAHVNEFASSAQTQQVPIPYAQPQACFYDVNTGLWTPISNSQPQPCVYDVNTGNWVPITYAQPQQQPQVFQYPNDVQANWSAFNHQQQQQQYQDQQYQNAYQFLHSLQQPTQPIPSQPPPVDSELAAVGFWMSMTTAVQGQVTPADFVAPEIKPAHAEDVPTPPSHTTPNPSPTDEIADAESHKRFWDLVNRAQGDDFDRRQRFNYSTASNRAPAPPGSLGRREQDTTPSPLRRPIRPLPQRSPAAKPRSPRDRAPLGSEEDLIMRLEQERYLEEKARRSRTRSPTTDSKNGETESPVKVKESNKRRRSDFTSSVSDIAAADHLEAEGSPLQKRKTVHWAPLPSSYTAQRRYTYRINTERREKKAAAKKHARFCPSLSSIVGFFKFFA
ncbi:hypothetical protein BDZ97DRAFT_1104540 [Flammula alnicola]|nr:hypothetical protein BDZ97DRAFT_1104540 [Flammula alnicola]